MKLSAKTLLVGFLVTACLFMFIGSMLTWKCGKEKEIKVEVMNPMIALQFDQMLNTQIRLRNDLRDLYKTWTFTTAKGETVYIDSTTPWKDIPIIDTEFDTALTIKVDDSPLRIGLLGIVTTKGRPKSLILRPYETTYYTKIKVKRRAVDLFGGAFAYVNQSYRISGEIVGGMRFFDHYAIIGKAELDNDMKGNIKLGVGYVF